MAWRAVADHTVGGVDCFVECRSRETGDGHPEHRRDDSVGKILGKAFDCRAGDAGGIECADIAADDFGDCRAAGDDAALFQRGGDIGDVLVQAALRDQGAGDDGDADQSERQAKQLAFDNEGNCADNAEEQTGSRRCQRLVASTRRPCSRLSKRSSAAIRRPIQVTGWPIARNSACG